MDDAFSPEPNPQPPPFPDWYDPYRDAQPPSLPIALPYRPPVEPDPISLAYPPRRVVTPSVIAPPPTPVVRPMRQPYPDDWDEEAAEKAFRYRRAKRLASIVPLMITVVTFAGMMCVSFGASILAIVSEIPAQTPTDDEIRDGLVRQTLAFEGIDSVLVLLGILIAGRPLARAAAGHVGVAWALAAPGFVFFLGVNLVYHLIVSGLVSMAIAPDGATEAQPPPVDIDLFHAAFWAILLTCVQPAIIEELFFRYLLLGHLRSHLGIHSSIWLSSVVFGMAHLGNIPGWPVLILIGVGLGYARVYSGGLILPIILHFLHNFAILLIQDG